MQSEPWHGLSPEKNVKKSADSGSETSNITTYILIFDSISLYLNDKQKWLF